MCRFTRRSSGGPDPLFTFGFIYFLTDLSASGVVHPPFFWRACPPLFLSAIFLADLSAVPLAEWRTSRSSRADLLVRRYCGGLEGLPAEAWFTRRLSGGLVRRSSCSPYLWRGGGLEGLPALLLAGLTHLKIRE